MERLYGFPHYHIHSADLQAILMDATKSLNVAAKLGAKVDRFEARKSIHEQDAVLLTNGTRVYADVFIGADGSHRVAEAFQYGGPVQGPSANEYACRARIPGYKLEDAVFQSLDIKQNLLGIWGPGCYIIGYYVRDLQYYNLVIVVPAPQSSATNRWDTIADLASIKQHFKGWDWRVQRLLNLIDPSDAWQLLDHPALDRWLHPVGNWVLVGGAAHPILLNVAQATSSAAEDAAAIAECLEYVAEDQNPCGLSIRDVLKVYESLRMPRSREMMEQTRKNKRIFVMRDGRQPLNCRSFQRLMRPGPAQEARDAALKADTERRRWEGQAAMERSPTYLYDVIANVRRHFDRMST